MAAKHFNLLLRQIRRLAGSPDEEDGDSRLLERFLTGRDEAAFTTLVRRHGPMVYGLCRRVLHNEHDAEDAFQATFLVLARKAASIRHRPSLGGFLHEVAYHIALRVRANAARRQQHERQVDAMSSIDPLREATQRELRPLLDEELRQLPAKYSEPLILCYLEGKTNEEAARQLGWPIGSMSRRLARGRELLRRRLIRRGITLSAGVLATALAEEATAALVPPALVQAAVRTALQVGAGTVPASVASLVEVSMREMFLAKIRMTLLVVLGIVGIGAGALAYQHKAVQPAEEKLSPPVAKQDRPTAGQAKRARTDLYGDPLPPGALARLGTIRLRHLSAAVVFSRDGKTLISAGGDGTLRYWEPATGKEMRRLRVKAEDSLGRPSVFAADGKTVAGCVADTIRVWDTDMGKERKRFPVGKVSIPGLEHLSVQVYRLALSPDGKKLAAQLYDLKTHDIHLWDVSTGKQFPTLKAGESSDNLAFSSDGKLLGTISSNKGLRLWNTATGKEVRKIAGAQWYLALSPDDKRAAAVSRGGGVKVWNMADGKECFDLKPVPGRYPGSLAFAPDNKTLAIGFPDELLFYDVAAGKQLRKIPAGYGQVVFSPNQVVFSPDGKTVASSGTAIHLWDMATGKEIGPRAGHEATVTSLAIAPDGGSVATISHHDRVVRVWDAASGRPLVHMTAHKFYARDGAFSPDGRLLITGGGDNILRSWDSKTGKELRQFTVESTDPEREDLQIRKAAFSSDGERLAALVMGGEAYTTYQVVIWDVSTGKSLARRANVGADFNSRFSPDVRSIANPRGAGVVVEDIVTGQEIVKTAGKPPLAYSPDGQILATTLYKPSSLSGEALPGAGWAGLPEDAEAIVLTELATGKRLARIQTERSGFSLLAYSPDGRTLATADKDSFRLWDIATGKECFRRALPEKRREFGSSFAESLAFFPGGNRLATGLMDSTVLIWDLDRKSWHGGMAVKELDKRDLKRLWSDLAGEDAAKAHQAVWTLAAVPTSAIPFLKDHLHPVSAVDAKQLQRLIGDLDSPAFSVREDARKKLASFGEQAEPALRQALQGKPSLEMRKRLESLHAEAQQTGYGIVRSTDVLRTLRALRSLEHMGSREARQVLQTLAEGDPAARSTRQAREALRRLANRVP